MNLEQFLWHCFAHSAGLPEFLNELRPHFRPSGGAPTPACAGEWLNPVLVAKGFSLGIAKVRGGKIVRIPVVWVFGDNVGTYGSRNNYSRVDFIDWTTAGCKLLRHYDCWGTGAQALRRLLHTVVDTLNGPLLTEAGEARMRQVLEWAHSKAKPSKRLVLVSEKDKILVSEIRKSLLDIENVLSSNLSSKLDQISEKSYAGLLRTCVLRGLERQTCTLLGHRPLPQFSRENLLKHFVDSVWCTVWKVCSNEAQSYFTQSKYGGYTDLMSQVLRKGNANLLRAVLNSLSEIGVNVAQYLVEHVFEEARDDLFDVILTSPIVQPVRDECLLRCFTHSLSGHRRSHAMAFRLLELGVKPIRIINSDDAFGLRMWLLENENLPVLKSAFELDNPTENAVTALLDCFHLKPGETYSWLCTVSKGLPKHKARIERVAFRSTVSFIRSGAKENLELLNESFAEGVSLMDVPWSAFENAKLLTGARRHSDEGNWIDLIAHLIRTGRTEDATVLKKLKRSTNQSRRRTRPD